MKDACSEKDCESTESCEVSGRENTASDFEAFKTAFKYYQKLFGLTGFKVVFAFDKTNEESYAEIFVDLYSRRAIITLSKDHSIQESVADYAKHEALHLLLAKLKGLAAKRFLSPDDINDAEEEIVRKLSNFNFISVENVSNGKEV